MAKAQWKVESLSARLTYNNKQSLVDIFPIITRAQSETKLLILFCIMGVVFFFAIVIRILNYMPGSLLQFFDS